MKRLLSLASILVVSSALSTSALALTQDNSFTFISTAGMFEDIYDSFKYSPAYMPSFAKSTLWSQMSNLQNTEERMINQYGPWHPTTWSGTAYQTNNYYLLGGQTNLMDMGRIGGMLDWWSQSAPQSVTDVNGNDWSGFGESTDVLEEDLDSDGQYERRYTSYGRIEKVNHSYDNDIYLAYGMGGIAGFDLGAGLRCVWESNQPTWNTWNNNESLDEVQQITNYDLIGERNTYTLDLTREGTLNYGGSEIDLVLGGRSKGGLVTDLDLIVNVVPIMVSNTNEYEYTYSRSEDTDPLDNNVYNRDSYKEEGIEPGTGFYPGSGIGVAVNVRGDYSLNKNVIVTGTAGFGMVPLTLADAKQDRTTADDEQTWSPSLDLLRDQLNITDNDTYEGTMNDSAFYLGLRAQYLAEGWKLGMGIRASSSNSTDDITIKNAFRSEDIHSGEPVEFDNVTTVVTYDYEGNSKTVVNQDVLELPIGVVINITDTFAVRLGAKHVIQVLEQTESFELTSQSNRNTVTERGDGSSTQSLGQIDDRKAYEESTLSVLQYNEYHYGLTWWPYPNLQIDLTGFEYLVYLGGYQLSATFHF